MRHAKSRLVEAADKSAPVRLETAPTGPLFGRRCFQLRRFTPQRHLPGGESVYLFFEVTII